MVCLSDTPLSGGLLVERDFVSDFLSFGANVLFGGWKDGNPMGVVWRGGVHVV